MLNNYLGKVSFSHKDLQRLQKRIESRRDWLAKRGIAYLLVIAPDKHTIHPEFLPPWMAKVRVSSKLDEFIKHMNEHSNVPVLDLRAPLLEAKKKGPQFFATDTHWHASAAFLGYQNIIRALARQLPSVGYPLEMSDFVLEPCHTKTDLAQVVGMKGDEFAEKTFELRPKITLPNPQKHPGLIKGHSWPPLMEPVVCENDQRTLKALVFRDSFANHWPAWLGHHFAKVTFLWTRTWNFKFIESEKPDVLIDQMVERFLNDTFLGELENNLVPNS